MLLAGEGLCNVELQRFLKDAQNWFVCLSVQLISRIRVIMIRIVKWIHAFFALSAVLVSEVDYTGETAKQKRLAPDSLWKSFLQWFQWTFHERWFSVKMLRIIARPREVLILLTSFVATTLLGSTHGCETLGLLARSAHCTNVYLVSLIAGVQEAGLNVHDIFLVSGSADVLGYEMSSSSACCSGISKQISRIRAVADTVSASRLH